MLQIVLVSGPGRTPRRVAELGNGVCRAQVELDVVLDCRLALLCDVCTCGPPCNLFLVQDHHRSPFASLLSEQQHHARRQVKLKGLTPVEFREQALREAA